MDSFNTKYGNASRVVTYRNRRQEAHVPAIQSSHEDWGRHFALLGYEQQKDSDDSSLSQAPATRAPWKC